MARSIAKALIVYRKRGDALTRLASAEPPLATLSRMREREG
jgi:hypothetical protein